MAERLVNVPPATVTTIGPNTQVGRDGSPAFVLLDAPAQEVIVKTKTNLKAGSGRHFPWVDF